MLGYLGSAFDALDSVELQAWSVDWRSGCHSTAAENVVTNTLSAPGTGTIKDAGMKGGLGLADESEPAEDSVHEGEREDGQQAALVTNRAGHERNRRP